MTVFQHFSPLARLLLLAVVAANLFPAASSIATDNMYFVHALPNGSDQGGRPIQTIIYQWDGTVDTVVETWSLPANSYTSTLNIYLEAVYVVIGEGPDTPQMLYGLPMGNEEDTIVIDLHTHAMVFHEHLLQDSTGNRYLLLSSLNEESGKSGELVDSLFMLGEGVNGGNVSKSLDEMLPEMTYGKYDYATLGFREKPAPGARSQIHKVTFPGPGVPDSLVPSTPCWGWVWSAATAEFDALCVWIDEHRLDFRDVYVLNRHTSEWSFLQIRGGATKLRPLNGWLVGRVAYSSPTADHARRVSGPPVERDEMVILNPMTGHTFYEPMGTWSDILWLEDDAVYYRAFDTLYRARIENDAFVDRELLLQGDTAFYMTAAYRGRD